jgi:hypothetical protein
MRTGSQRDVVYLLRSSEIVLQVVLSQAPRNLRIFPMRRCPSSLLFDPREILVLEVEKDPAISQPYPIRVLQVEGPYGE